MIAQTDISQTERAIGLKLGAKGCTTGKWRDHDFRENDNMAGFLRSSHIPYSRKIWRGIKFGALADRSTYRQIKIRQYLIHVSIPRAHIHARSSSMYAARADAH